MLKIIRIGLLLAIKESYLFLRNSLGLAVHPFKTLRELELEKDRSQQVLILGWPVYVLSLGWLVISFLRWTLGLSWRWGSWARLGLSLVEAVSLVLAGYLFYWWLRVRRLR